MSVIKLQGKQGTYTFDPHNPSSVLGEGGMGAVYKGEQTSIMNDGITEPYTRTVAVKILYRELTANPANIERAKIEATIQIHHKNLIEIYDFVEQNGIYHTICEYLTGENLSNKIAELKAQGQAFSEKEAINIILQVCDGLKELHKLGIIHRDIDPTNIRLLEDGGVKLFDFSIVKKTDSVSKMLTTTGGMIGKPHYASPEQILNLSAKDITPSTDIYSVGITLYEMLTGELPFEGGSEAAIAAKKTKENLPKNEMLSSEMYEIIKKATNPNKENRYRTIDEFSNSLTSYRDRSSNLGKKRKRLWLAIAACILILIGAGFFIYKKIYKKREYVDYSTSADSTVTTEPVENNEATIGYTLIPTISEQNKWGFLNQSLQLSIPFKYDFAYFFEDGIALVRLNGKWGGIDEKGNEVIPVKYEDYKLKRDFSENYYLNFFQEGLIPVKLNGKWGFIDKTGTEIIPFKYENAGNFSEGIIDVQLNGKWGFIDKTSNVIIPFKFDDIDDFSEGLAPAQLNGKWGFIDKTGKEIIPFKYDDGRGFRGGLAAVQLNGKWGFIDKAGKEITPFKYFAEGDFYEELAAVQLDKKGGFIDKTGKEIIPFKFDNESGFSEGLAAVQLNGKVGFIDKTGNEIITFKYGAATDFSDGLAAVNLKGKWGFINKTGNEVISFKYEEVDGPFKNGHVLVGEKNSFGKSMYFIDKNGNRIGNLELDTSSKMTMDTSKTMAQDSTSMMSTDTSMMMSDTSKKMMDSSKK